MSWWRGGREGEGKEGRGKRVAFNIKKKRKGSERRGGVAGAYGREASIGHAKKRKQESVHY